jgi:mannose-1-phosphate guanylyltransferase
VDIFLLSAGFGTRLKPLTSYIPKCLAPIGSVPLLAIWLHQLSSYSFVSKIYINCHHLAHQVKDFVDSNNFDIDIELIFEQHILGTSGSIRHSLGISSSNEFMIIHADNLSIQDFAKMYDFFKARILYDTLAGVALGFTTQLYSDCGFYTYSEETLRIIDFIEKPGCQVNGIGNAAIFMFTRELLLMALECSDGNDFCKDNLPQIASYLYLFKATNLHLDIGNPTSLGIAQKYRSLFESIELDRQWHYRYIQQLEKFSPTR